MSTKRPLPVLAASRPADWTDAELLAGFAETHAESAIAELVRRHASLVYGACLRVLRDAHEAEDVSQAVFLLLCRRAPTLPGRVPVRAWLYRTASMAALKVRQKRDRRRSLDSRRERTSQMADKAGRTSDVALQSDLDEAMASLPNQLRDAVALRYLGGLSQARTAEELGCSTDAAAKRVSRGIERLRLWFRKRGALVTTGALSAVLAQAASAEASGGLVAGTVALCTGGAVVTGGQLTLVKEIQNMLWWIKAKVLAAGAAAVCLAAGAGVGGAYALGGPSSVRSAVTASPEGPRPLAAPPSRPETAAPKPAAPGAWPNWRGPDCSGGVDEPGVELVDDLGRAKLVWKSEEKVPLSYGRMFDSKEKVNGGFCDPAVAGGRVFLYYTRPSGPVAENYLDAGQYGKYHESLGMDVVRQCAMIRSDDVFISLDAATGRLLWRREFVGKGMNYCDMRCYPHSPQCIPAVAGARLYGQGSTGRIYCLDVKDGEPLWEAESGERVKALETEMQKFIEAKKKPGPAGGGPWTSGWFDSSVVVADGVVVVCDWWGKGGGKGTSGFGMSGLDGESGRALWNVPECTKQYVSPCRWVHEGGEHVIGAGPRRAVCVEPKTGRVVWRIEGEHVHEAGGTPALTGDRLVLSAAPGKMTRKESEARADTDGITCYRISLEGAEKAWAFPVKDGSFGDSSPIIHRGHVYAPLRGKGLVCIDLESGKVVAELGKGAGGYGPIAANGRIFGASSGGFQEVAFINADPRDFKVLPGNKELKVGPYLSPAFAGGRLYVRGAYHVYCWDLRKR